MSKFKLVSAVLFLLCSFIAYAAPDPQDPDEESFIAVEELSENIRSALHNEHLPRIRSELGIKEWGYNHHVLARKESYGKTKKTTIDIVTIHGDKEHHHRIDVNMSNGHIGNPIRLEGDSMREKVLNTKSKKVFGEKTLEHMVNIDNIYKDNANIKGHKDYNYLKDTAGLLSSILNGIRRDSIDTQGKLKSEIRKIHLKIHADKAQANLGESLKSDYVALNALLESIATRRANERKSMQKEMKVLLEKETRDGRLGRRDQKRKDELDARWNKSKRIQNYKLLSSDIEKFENIIYDLKNKLTTGDLRKEYGKAKRAKDDASYYASKEHKARVEFAKSRADKIRDKEDADKNAWNFWSDQKEGAQKVQDVQKAQANADQKDQGNKSDWNFWSDQKEGAQKVQDAQKAQANADQKDRDNKSDWEFWQKQKEGLQNSSGDSSASNDLNKDQKGGDSSSWYNSFKTWFYQGDKVDPKNSTKQQYYPGWNKIKEDFLRYTRDTFNYFGGGQGSDGKTGSQPTQGNQSAWGWGPKKSNPQSGTHGQSKQTSEGRQNQQSGSQSTQENQSTWGWWGPEKSNSQSGTQGQSKQTSEGEQNQQSGSSSTHSNSTSANSSKDAEGKKVRDRGFFSKFKPKSDSQKDRYGEDDFSDEDDFIQDGNANLFN